MPHFPLACLIAVLAAATPTFANAGPQPVRARDLGVPFDGAPGPLNAITDVPGVLVGQTTLIRGEGAHAVRTGVTAILPRATLG